MKVHKDVGNYRVISYDRLILEDTNTDEKYYTLEYNVLVQVKVKILFWKYWITVKKWITLEDDSNTRKFLLNEAIELFNNIVYPYKYFITNG